MRKNKGRVMQLLLSRGEDQIR